MSGGIQSGLPSTQTPQPIIGDGWIQIGGSSGTKVYFDQLSKADQDLVIQYLLSAQFPVLNPPSDTAAASSGGNKADSVSATGAAVKMDQNRHDIVMQMLDKWIENLQKIAKENRKDNEEKSLKTLEISLHEIKHQQTSQPNEIFPIFALGFIVIGTGILQGITPDTLGVGAVQNNPIVNMSNHVIPPSSIIGDTTAQLALLGSLFVTGVQYFTVAQLIAQEGGKEAPKDAAFAKGYAENILGLVGTASFNSFLMAIVTQSVPKDKTIAPQRAGELVAMVKIILLSSALAMLYQAEAGKMTGTEFAAMLSGNIKFEVGDLKGQLVTQLKANLKLLSPKDQEKIITGLLEFFDGNPSMETLAEPSKVFAGLARTLSRGELAV